MIHPSEPPGPSKFARVAAGVVGAGALGAYAIRAAIMRELTLPRRSGVSRVEGADAVILGVAFLGLAAVVHFHFSGEDIPRSGNSGPAACWSP